MKGKSLVSFDRQLLDHIEKRQNVEAKSIITENLVKAHDKFGTLLHYAARHGNSVIARHLIELGSKVDAIGEGGGTPLVVAVKRREKAIVDILLKAEANIDIANGSGKSALQLVFHESYMEGSVMPMFLRKVRADASTTEEWIGKLVGAGCTLYHATYSRDVKMLECMLTHGFDVNSRDGPWNRTALYAAARLDDFSMAKWLVDKGADVNALDVHDQGPLYINAQHGNKEMLQFLLEQGADPNAGLSEGDTPLCAAVFYSAGTKEETAECVESLLQYGATIPHQNANRFSYQTIFDSALNYQNFKVINILIGHLAVLERLGTPIDKSVMSCNEDTHRDKFHLIKEDYELCLETLDIAVFGKSTLLDLLIESEEQMKIHVRNETFLPTIEHFCSKYYLKEYCSYFYKRLMKSISRAEYLIKLENTAILVICKLLKGDYSQCYIAARKVCDYLDEADLVQLSRM